MADSSYVALKNESSTSWYEMVLCEDTQSPQNTPPVTDTVLTPGGHFKENGKGRGKIRCGSTRGRGKCGCIRGGRGCNGQASGNVKTTTATGSNNNGAKQQKPPCILCGEQHYHNLMYCKELPKYLPYGNIQKVLPNSVCQVCLCTGNKQICPHGCNKHYQATLCATSGKHFLMCPECPDHMPALQYLKENHDAKAGWNNLHFLRGALGHEAYKSMIAAKSVDLSDSTVLKTDKGVQVDLDQKDAIGEEAEMSHQIRRSTLNEAICFIMVGLMHMASEINHIPS